MASISDVCICWAIDPQGATYHRGLQVRPHASAGLEKEAPTAFPGTVQRARVGARSLRLELGGPERRIRDCGRSWA